MANTLSRTRNLPLAVWWPAGRVFSDHPWGEARKNYPLSSKMEDSPKVNDLPQVVNPSEEVSIRGSDSVNLPGEARVAVGSKTDSEARNSGFEYIEAEKDERRPSSEEVERVYETMHQSLVLVDAHLKICEEGMDGCKGMRKHRTAANRKIREKLKSLLLQVNFLRKRGARHRTNTGVNPERAPDRGKTEQRQRGENVPETAEAAKTGHSAGVRQSTEGRRALA